MCTHDEQLQYLVARSNRGVSLAESAALIERAEALRTECARDCHEGTDQA